MREIRSGRNRVVSEELPILPVVENATARRTDVALNRPLHQIHCAENSDLASLAAAYCFGIAKNHPFVDGNKRAAFHSLLLFLDNNGCELTAGMAECIQIVLGTAAGEVSEPELAVWIRQNLNEID